MARHVVRNGEGDHRAGQGDQNRHQGAAPRHIKIGGREDLNKVAQPDFADDLAREVVQPEKTVGQQAEQRTQIDDAKPQQGRHQQQAQQQAALGVEQSGQAIGQTKLRGVDCLCHEAASLRFAIGCAALVSQSSCADSPTAGDVVRLATGTSTRTRSEP